MSRGAVAIKAKGVLAVRRRVAANPLRGGLNQAAVTTEDGARFVPSCRRGRQRGSGTCPPCARRTDTGCGSTGDGPVHQHLWPGYPAAVVCFTDGAAVDERIGASWARVGTDRLIGYGRVVRPLMTKIETNVMVVRLYFGRDLPVSSVSDPRWPGRVGFDSPRVKDLHEELP